MADTPTTRGAYRKQGLGDRSAAWGLASGLNGVFDSLDEAIHGFNGVSLATVNYTLSSTSFTTNEVRQRFHRFTNGGISANATITVPATQNWWLISNAVSGFDLVVSNGSNSVTIDDGLTALVATDGTNVYEFPMFSTLLAPDPGSNGIVVRTALGATVARSIVVSSAGLAITSGDGVSANPTISLDAGLSAIAALAKTDGNIIVGDGSTWVAESGATARASLGLTIGTDVQAYDADLAAVAALASTGLIARTGSGAVAARTITAPAAGITVTAGDGVSANPTLALANDLAAVEGLATTGLAVRTAADTWAARTLTGPAAGVSVTNGDGVSGNPTISLANDLSAVEGLSSNGIAVRTATDTWAVRTLTAGGGITITHGDGISANPTVAVDINGSASAVGGVASDDEVLIYDTSASAIRKATVATISGSSSTTVSISANDTTPAVLATKLVAGTGITLTENNDGGNETLTVAAASAVTGPGGSTDNAWARWSGSAGTAIQNGAWVEADTGAVTAGGDLDMSGYDLTVDFSTVSAAGEHAEENDANATGTVTIQATDPTVLRRTLTGDVTLHVAGAPTPGYRNPNLLTYSEQFDNAAWTKGGGSTISANAAVAPNGETTADKLVESGTTSAFTVQRPPAVTGSHTFSVFAKAAERTWLSMRFSGTTNSDAYFNLSTGAVGFLYGCTASVVDFGDGWYRCIVTATVAGIGDQVVIRLASANNTALYAGDGSSGAYIWGAQLVEGSDPLVYRSVEAIRQAYGYGWSTELRSTQDGTGGRDLTILPVNQLTYSADLQSTAEAGETRPWMITNSILSANAAVGPDGQTNMTKLIEDTGTNSARRNHTILHRSVSNTERFCRDQGRRQQPKLLSGAGRRCHARRELHRRCLQPCNRRGRLGADQRRRCERCGGNNYGGSQWLLHRHAHWAAEFIWIKHAFKGWHHQRHQLGAKLYW
jgi:hypothetical protein